ncbi:MAG: hypothetical protein WBR18_14410 [Anaerolineales bacterium]
MEEYDRVGNQSYGFLADGLPIPEDYSISSWYLLDANSLVKVSIAFMLDPAGAVVQKVLYSDGVRRNLTLHEDRMVEPWRFTYDYGFLDLLKRGESWYGSLTLQVVLVDGQPLLSFVAHQDHGEVTIVIDRETGQPVQSCIRRFDSNDNVKYFSCARVLQLSRTSPPKDILDILQIN